MKIVFILFTIVVIFFLLYYFSNPFRQYMNASYPLPLIMGGADVPEESLQPSSDLTKDPSYPTIVNDHTQNVKNMSYDSLRRKNIDYMGSLLQQYYLQYKAAPQSLQTLVEVGLARTIPVDPQTKEPLVYQVTSDQWHMCVVSTKLSTNEEYRAYCKQN